MREKHLKRSLAKRLEAVVFSAAIVLSVITFPEKA